MAFVEVMRNWHQHDWHSVAAEHAVQLPLTAQVLLKQGVVDEVELWPTLLLVEERNSKEFPQPQTERTNHKTTQDVRTRILGLPFSLAPFALPVGPPAE